MDRYDIYFLLNKIKEAYLMLLRKDLYKNYLLKKKEYLLMEYYKLRTQRSSRYQEKHNKGKLEHRAVEKALILDRNTRYTWDMFKPMKEHK